MNASVIYVGLDVHKDSIVIAIARPGRESAEDWKTLPNDGAKLRKSLKSLARNGEVLRVCYEAGPTGFGLCRNLREVQIDCTVVAPSLVPSKPGDRVKTDRRDARKLAQFHRSGDLTEVHVPEQAVEAIRDLERARNAAKRAERVARHQLSKFLLRNDRHWDGTTAWTKKHLDWVRVQKFDYAAQQRVLEDYLKAVEDLAERVDRLTDLLAELVEDTTLAPLVKALQAFRGVSLVSAVTIAAETGDLKRFQTPQQFMSYVGLVPSEDSTGTRRRQGRITRCGNGHLRTILVEAAWHYRHLPYMSQEIRRRNQGVADGVRKIAWEAQKRLNKRMYHLIHAGKGMQKTVTALARELAGFIWAVGQEETLLETKSP
jgi:transposase